jgi:septal ring-binding cell division protein DamX
LIIVILLLSTAVSAAAATTERLSIPIRLDYPMLQHLLQNQLFNTPDGRAEILNDPSGCSRIFLSDPKLEEQQPRLAIEARLEADIGAPLFGNCTSLFDWDGRVKFVAEPIIQAGAKALSLKILSTELYDAQGRLINSGRLWELANGQLQTLLSRYRVDLAPAIDELKRFLPEVLNRRSAGQLARIADSLRLGRIEVRDDDIRLEVDLQVERLPPEIRPEPTLGPAEMRALETKWRMMDAMITFAVKQYAGATRLQSLREALLEILLDARYRLRDALAQPVSREQDPVRHWFIDSWRRLGPILRQISLERPGREPMLLVSLLAATDALETLDRLGPSIGLDISVDGLRRLGRLLIDRHGVDPLHYDEAVDPELRRLFRLPSSPQPAEPSGFHIDLWPIGDAWAGGIEERLKLWVPDREELPEYLPLVRELLMQSEREVARREGLPTAQDKLYRHLVLTTAWQESCWRQFEVVKDKVVPLRSGSGDIGLMQVNERVWRGFYDLQKLRWDVRYNAEAGAEILLQYLLNYALKKGEQKHKGGMDNLARASYSAYNGGPGAIARYRSSKTGARGKKIDRAFWDKYRLVKQGRELQVAECLGGDSAELMAATNRPAAHSPAGTTPKRSASSPQNLGKDWILAQPSHHFTLQLAVFGSLDAAQRFRADQTRPDPLAIAPLGRDQAGQFVVLSGSYPTRSAADQARKRHRRLKPWVRPFQDIQAVLQ